LGRTTSGKSKIGYCGTIPHTDLRRSRYIGLAKTHLQHVLTAAAMNLTRIAAWLGGTPLARTRQSAFTKLMMLPSCP
jgi:hypothetical protein